MDANFNLVSVPDLYDFRSIDRMSVNNEVNYLHLKLLKELSNSDEKLASWLSLRPKTLDRIIYEKRGLLRIETSERIILLLSLFKKGVSKFSSSKMFNDWLDLDSPIFEGQSRGDLLHLYSGIWLVYKELINDFD